MGAFPAEGLRAAVPDAPFAHRGRTVRSIEPFSPSAKTHHLGPQRPRRNTVPHAIEAAKHREGQVTIRESTVRSPFPRPKNVVVRGPSRRPATDGGPPCARGRSARGDHLEERELLVGALEREARRRVEHHALGLRHGLGLRLRGERIEPAARRGLCAASVRRMIPTATMPSTTYQGRNDGSMPTRPATSASSRPRTTKKKIAARIAMAMAPVAQIAPCVLPQGGRSSGHARGVALAPGGLRLRSAVRAGAEGTE